MSTMRVMLKAWSSGGVAAAGAVMVDLTMDLFSSADATKGFAETAKAIQENIEPPDPRLKLDEREMKSAVTPRTRCFTSSRSAETNAQEIQKFGLKRAIPT
jgi:hypothetical protein